MKLRVLLVDDSQIIRDALRMILEMESDLEVVGEVGNGCDAMEAVGKTCPDVVCMDINMPGMNGIEVTRQLLGVYANLKVIGLSAYTDSAQIVDILAAGASCYVVKKEAGTELVEAIRTVCQSQIILS